MTKKNDYCLRGISADGSIKFMVADTSVLCEQARAKHDAWSLAAAALGRLLTAGVFFGFNLKNDDNVTLRLDGDGPLGTLVVVADSQGAVRGYVANPTVDIPRKPNGKLHVGAGVGQGTLTVIKDMGLGEPYVSSINLVTGEIGDDFAHYFAESEQVPSAIGLGVLVDTDGSVKVAGGFLVQVMPDAKEQTLMQLELNIANLLPVTEMLNNGANPEEICREIMLGIPYEILQEEKPVYQCTCSRERMSSALISLGHKEIDDLIKEQGEAELVCRFCGEKHYFNKEELESIAQEIDKKRFQEFAGKLGIQK